MLTKMKLAIVMCASLAGIAGIAGIAAADAGAGQSPDVAAKIQAKKAERAERKAQMLAKYDTNKDGKLDANERAVMKEDLLTTRFKKMDLDGDGKISFDEFKQAKQNMRHARGFHRHHRKGGAPADGSTK